MVAKDLYSSDGSTVTKVDHPIPHVGRADLAEIISADLNLIGNILTVFTRAST